MSGREDRAVRCDFGAGYWEDRYRNGAPTSVDVPSPALVTELGVLSPGRALDAGCGRGANAIWLASRGWHVTAVDVSATALARAQDTARAGGPDVADRIEWVHADLVSWHPGELGFDLVTSLYVHLPGSVDDLIGRLAACVSPGGTLLVVGHDSGPGDHGRGHSDHHDRGHAHPDGSRIRTEQVTALLPQEEWEVVVAESRTQRVQRPDGAGAVSLRDAVVRARRTGHSRL